ncbi:aminotransferase class I/II-fold pyridoxal phosphate-dependent enzyme [Methyloligella solikamskensis]|uniref:Aminotransferase n=1 Tax=Methyloligella solikamskensis TaxID=1177756 RepID=A0ABW3JBV8_9HYPH
MDVMREANARVARGDDIIHMEVGQPATPAPKAALAAAEAALRSDKLGYTDALGIPALRERIAAFYGERYGVSVPPERVVVTAGSSAGFILAFLAILEAGDSFGLPNPGYPCYRHILKALGAEARLIAPGIDDRWMPHARHVEELKREGAKGLLVASPNNPTGTMAVDRRIGEIAKACARERLWLVSDEIYHGLEYDRPAETALAASGEAIVVNSFSKYFSMTGWRIGWLVVPEDLVRPIERLAQNLYISTSAIAQHAALGAFDGIEELDETKAVYAANRALLLEELPKAGFKDILPADGAFYLYADTSEMADDSRALCQAMLDRTGVAATPGLDFDPEQGHRFVRFSYAGSLDEMREASRRLKAWRESGQGR